MSVALVHTEAPLATRRPHSPPDYPHASQEILCSSVQQASVGYMASREQSSSGEPVIHSHHSHTTSNDELPQPLPVQILRKSHARSRSTSSLSPRPSPVAPALRERSASIPERPSSSKLTSSPHHFLTLPRGIVPQPTPVLPVETDSEETIGAFSPTSCPRRHLQTLLRTTPRSWKLRRKLERLRLDFDFAPDTQSERESPDGSPPLSPIPSICRTPSSYCDSEYFPTAPSSAGPATPVHSATTSPVLAHKALRPILEALEDASRFRVRTACAACAKPGSNFPCCPRCNEMWCSRECRLKSTGGKRHSCKKT
ncbi:hypothetical protein PsYK624_133510 [Phanerochaete sordida]|uniref:Uncharacterized protein n=1 Tax=Phanerochaete sordida TaxID=48140 RepID=A0A9P3GMU4_9APHY|nr:hypothetical protein PsYK624_133510 [Phanerochaete sordida]